MSTAYCKNCSEPVFGPHVCGANSYSMDDVASPHPDQQYSDEQLRYTVERIVRDGIGLGGTYSWTGPTNRIVELIAAREQRLLDRIGEEVIGSDQAEEVIDDTGEEYPVEGAHECNRLRAEQRQKLAAIRSKL